MPEGIRPILIDPLLSSGLAGNASPFFFDLFGLPLILFTLALLYVFQCLYDVVMAWNSDVWGSCSFYVSPLDNFVCPGSIRHVLVEFHLVQLHETLFSPEGGIETKCGNFLRMTLTACVNERVSGSVSPFRAASCISPRMA